MRDDAVAARRGLVLRTIYALCLLGATGNHWIAIYRHGFFWDYGGFPRASTMFWTALALIDPAAVLLLFRKPRIGVAATAAIIMVDVIHNVWIAARHVPALLHGFAGAAQMIGQVAFMIFVAITAPFAWRRAGPARA